MNWRAALAAGLAAGAVSAQNGADQRAWLDLFVNGVEKEPALVRLRGDPVDDVVVLVADLEKAGLHGLRGSREMHEQGEMVSLRSLAPQVSFKVDDAALAVRIVAAPEMLEAQHLDMRPVQRPAELVLHTDTSAFLNWSATAASSGDFTGAAELGASWRGNLLYSGATLLPGGRAVRGLTNLTLDDPDRLRRTTVGDLFASGDALGGSALVMGVGVAREFSLDPYFVRQPLPRITGAVLTPSTLDVYVNGTLVQERPIAPGTFDVQNLPVTSGSGSVSYVVRDAFGRTQQYAAPYYAAAGLLADGVSEYSYSVGLRRLGFGESSFNYGLPVLLARHRIGFGDRLTAGARLEAGASGFASAGPSVTLALPMGQVDLAAAASLDGSSPGAAGSLTYSLLSRHLSAAVALRAMTDHYANSSLAGGQDRPRLQIQGQVGTGIVRGLGLNLDYGVASARDAGVSSILGLRADVRLSAKSTLFLSAQRSKNTGEEPQYGLFASLLYSFGSDTSGNVGSSAVPAANGNPARYGAEASVQKSPPLGEGFGYQIHSSLDGDQATGFGNVQAQGRYAQVLGSYSRIGRSDNGSLNAAGAVALVDGVLVGSRPLQQGYAVLSVPGVEGVRGYLNNQEVGRTDSRGYLLVPNLTPYYANRVSIGDADVPIDYEIGHIEQLIATPLRGGALVKFDVHKVQTVTGIVRVQDAIPAFGEVTAGAQTSPVGADGQFWLENLLPGTHQARVEYREGICRFRLEVPESKALRVDLGTIVCTEMTAVASAQ